MYTHYVHAAYRGALGRELGLGTRGRHEQGSIGSDAVAIPSVYVLYLLVSQRLQDSVPSGLGNLYIYTTILTKCIPIAVKDINYTLQTF